MQASSTPQSSQSTATSSRPAITPELEYFVGALRTRLNESIDPQQSVAKQTVTQHLQGLIDEVLKKTVELHQAKPAEVPLQKAELTKALLLLGRVIPTIDDGTKSMLLSVAGTPARAHENSDLIGFLTRWLIDNKDLKRIDLFLEVLREIETQGKGPAAEPKASSNGPREMGSICEYVHQWPASGNHGGREIPCRTLALYIETAEGRKGLKTCQKHHIKYEKETERDKRIAEKKAQQKAGLTATAVPPVVRGPQVVGLNPLAQPTQPIWQGHIQAANPLAQALNLPPTGTVIDLQGMINKAKDAQPPLQKPAQIIGCFPLKGKTFSDLSPQEQKEVRAGVEKHRTAEEKKTEPQLFCTWKLDDGKTIPSICTAIRTNGLFCEKHGAMTACPVLHEDGKICGVPASYSLESLTVCEQHYKARLSSLFASAKRESSQPKQETEAVGPNVTQDTEKSKPEKPKESEEWERCQAFICRPGEHPVRCARAAAAVLSGSKLCKSHFDLICANRGVQIPIQREAKKTEDKASKDEKKPKTEKCAATCRHGHHHCRADATEKSTADGALLCKKHYERQKEKEERRKQREADKKEGKESDDERLANNVIAITLAQLMNSFLSANEMSDDNDDSE